MKVQKKTNRLIFLVQSKFRTQSHKWQYCSRVNNLLSNRKGPYGPRNLGDLWIEHSKILQPMLTFGMSPMH